MKDELSNCSGTARHTLHNRKLSRLFPFLSLLMLFPLITAHVVVEKAFFPSRLPTRVTVSALYWHTELVFPKRPEYMPCYDCFAQIDLSLEMNCTRSITADLLLRNNQTAIDHPEYFSVKLTVGNGLVLGDNTLRIQHVGQPIMALVSYVGPGPCPTGPQCMTSITLRSERMVSIASNPPLTVYCHDRFLKLDPTSLEYGEFRPEAMQTCGGTINGPHFGGDWVKIHDCILGQQDTAKTIYRQWWAESKDGVRAMAIDTIYVLRLPPISSANLFCSEKDTLYCGDSIRQGGPYLLVPDPLVLTECDTIYLLDESFRPVSLDPKCGLSIKLDSLIFQNTSCAQVKRYTLKVYQSCYGTVMTTPCPLPPGSSNVQVSGGSGNPIYASCEFWLMELDTAGPSVHCDISAYSTVDTIDGIPTIIVPAGEDCAASGALLPPVLASDECNSVWLVKAMVDTIGLFAYEFDTALAIWRSTASLNLPLRTEPYPIYLEVMDGCFNLTRDTCAILVRDKTKPTNVTHSDIVFNLNTSVEWLAADQVDNHSYDNCGVNIMLVRRPDWQDCWQDFCDASSFNVLISPVMDTFFCKALETDPTVNALEAFYASEIQNLDDFSDCGALLKASWQYDLCRHATVDCEMSLTLAEFDSVYFTLFPDLDKVNVKGLGGGWASSVPIFCKDACGHIVVELLVMDYWCNWSINESTVWVDMKISNFVCPPDVSNLTCPEDVPNVETLKALVNSLNTDYCGELNCTVLNAGSDPVCINDTFFRTYQIELSDSCGNDTICTVTYSGSCLQFCSLSQGGWGNAGGNHPWNNPQGMLNTADIIDSLVNEYANGWLVVGDTTCSSSIRIEAACVVILIPGSGTPDTLMPSGHVQATLPDCKPYPDQFLTNQGRLKNTLAGMTIALQLNIWYSLEVTGNDLGALILTQACFDTVAGLPQGILTVQDLLDAGNAVLGGCNTYTNAEIDALNAMMDVINNAFIDCGMPTISASTPLDAITSGSGRVHVAELDAGQESLDLEPLITLHQNRPNPFQRETWIGFSLSAQDMVRLSVYDVYGKILYQMYGQYQAGYHEVLLTSDQINRPGIYYYQVDAKSGIYTSKMIKIE